MPSCAYAAFFSHALGQRRARTRASLEPAPPEPAWIERLNAASAGALDDFELTEAAMEALSEALFADTERLAESVIRSLISPGESAAELWIPQPERPSVWRRLRSASPARAPASRARVFLQNGRPRCEARPGPGGEGPSALDLPQACSNAIAWAGPLFDELAKNSLRGSWESAIQTALAAPALPEWATVLVDQAHNALSFARYEIWQINAPARLAARLAERLFPSAPDAQGKAALALDFCLPATPAIEPSELHALAVAFDQAPEAMILCSAAGPLALPDFRLDPGSPKRVKNALKTRFGLSRAGWSWLLRAMEREPEMGLNLAWSLRQHQLFMASPRPAASGLWLSSSSSHRLPYFYRRLPDGSNASPAQAQLLALCKLATLCAERSIDSAQTPSELSHLRAGLGTRESSRSSLLPLLIDPPAAWQRGLWEIRDNQRAPGRPRPAKAWSSLCETTGFPGAAPMDPRVFEALSEAAELALGPREASWLEAHRRRQARDRVCDALFATLLARDASSGSRRAQWEVEFQSFKDWSRNASSEALLALEGSCSWSSVSKAIRRWHENPVFDPEENLSWKPLAFERLECSNGCLARELLTSEALRLEGLALGHCVGSYARRCSLGRARVFSIQSGGKSLSTLEIAPIKPGRWDLGVQIAQHRGFGNAPAPAQSRLAAKEILAALARAKLSRIRRRPPLAFWREGVKRALAFFKIKRPAL